MRLRAAGPGDLAFVLALERRPAYAAFIHRWPRERHAASLEDPDTRLLIAEAPGRPEGPRAGGPRAEGPRAEGPRAEGPRAEGPRAEGPRAEGYVILAGLAGGNRSVELVRVVLDRPGLGLGGAVLRAVMAEAFGPLGGHRLWLDVFDDNTRARRAYLKAGFREEGLLRDCALEDGRFRSLVVMSILEPEYRLLAGRAGSPGASP